VAVCLSINTLFRPAQAGYISGKNAMIQPASKSYPTNI